MGHWRLLAVAIIFLCLLGCSRPWVQDGTVPLLPTSALPAALSVSTVTPQPSAAAASPTTSVPTATACPVPAAEIPVWISNGIPVKMRIAISGASGIRIVMDESAAVLKVVPGTEKTRVGIWVLALAAPFPTVADGIEAADLQAAWQGKKTKGLEGHALLAAPETVAILAAWWGSPAAGVVKIIPAGELSATAWKEKTSWAVLPFEELNPRWKVLRLDGKSPYDRTFDAATYSLAVPFSLKGADESLRQFAEKNPGLVKNPLLNRDPNKLTVLVMTGVSALVRGTAYFMEQKGLLFPGTEVRDWLRSADLTHISNEVSFNPKCPAPDPNDPNLRFCSQPKNIQLFEDMGVDIVELTGNHLNDFGADWWGYSLDLYRQRKWLFYGGGMNQAEARRAVTLENHGNRLAFIGCNPAGPKPDWATTEKGGTADCDYPEMGYLEAEIRRLKAEGYQVIVSVQFFESYDPRPLPIHYRDFRRLADAGAVIVSGSQAHLPQAMELRNDGFIHYGLGNLFFDQMDTPWPDTKDEFIDRHIFYDGRYLGVELLTARLVEYVKPRPMTPSEREIILRRIFDVSGWSINTATEWR